MSLTKVQQEMIAPVPSNYALSSSSGSFSHSGDTNYTDVTNLSDSITTTGRLVKLELVADGSAPASIETSRSSAGSNSTLAFLRNGSIIAEQDLTISLAGSVTASDLAIPPGSCHHTDVIGAGNYTYSVQVKSSNSSTTVFVSNCKLMIRET